MSDDEANAFDLIEGSEVAELVDVFSESTSDDSGADEKSIFGGGRKKYRKVIKLKAGKRTNFGKIQKCRKIFTRVRKGTIQFKITGDINHDGIYKVGSRPGVLSGGGGDFSPVTLNVAVTALVDSEFYIHLEWISKSSITFRG